MVLQDMTPGINKSKETLHRDVKHHHHNEQSALRQVRGTHILHFSLRSALLFIPL